jgi:dCMP deaminase
MPDALRPDWDQYFMQIARDVATRATCPRASVGAVIVRDRRILTTGYNGSPSGVHHCIESGCKMVDGHCVRTTHAEANAIVQAALHGVSVAGGTLYCTHTPCVGCTKLLISARVTSIVFYYDYRVDPFAVEMLDEAGIDLKGL